MTQSSSVEFSPLTDWVVAHEERFSRDRLPVFSAGGPHEQSRHGLGCPLFDVVHPAIPLRTTAPQTPQGAPKDGFGEAVVVCDMPEPFKFPTVDSCRLSWRVTCPNHASFRLVTVSRRGSCGPTRKLILFRTKSLVLCSK